MKRILTLLITAIIIALFACGCNDTRAQKETEPATEETAPSKNLYGNSSEMLKDYCKSFVEGDNPIYGTWEIEGLKTPCFIFRNDNLGEMAMGGEGNFASLTIDTERKTLSATFFVGINGDYNYSLSNNNKKLTLTEVTSGQTLTLIKRKDFNFVPKTPKNPKIDKSILGWWKSDNGQFYYFGSDGLMYSNQISIETFYTYNAEKGKIKGVYDYGSKVKVSLSYKINKSKLVIDGNTYEEYDPFD